MMGVLIGGAVLAGCAVCYQLLRSTLKEEVNHEWAGLIERRRASGELRIGVSRLEVQRV